MKTEPAPIELRKKRMSTSIIPGSDREASSSEPSQPAVSAEDQDHLHRFDLMRDLLRDRTRAVAEHYQNGCYIVGRPGSSKTFTILEELKRLGLPWTYRNSRMSAAGRYAMLQEHPQHAIVLDDIPTMLSDKASLQMLMAALGGEPGKPRPVTYTTKDTRLSFDFCGGIIAVSNVPLRRDPLADALQSRIPLLEHEPSDEMLAAFMRTCSAAGFEDLTPNECRDVVEFVIGESAACDYRLDLRVLRKGWQDYRLAKHGKARRPWKELVASGLKKIIKPVTPMPGSSREATKQREQDLARQLFRRFPEPAEKVERDLAWQAATGKSPDSLYRRRRELGDELQQMHSCKVAESQNCTFADVEQQLHRDEASVAVSDDDQDG